MRKTPGQYDDIDDQIKAIAKEVIEAKANEKALKAAIRDAYGRNDDQRGAVLEGQLTENSRYIRDSEDLARKLQSQQILLIRQSQDQEQ